MRLPLDHQQLQQLLAQKLLKAPSESEENTVPAAVLIAVLMVQGREPRIVFTRRTMTVATHKGQISLPGGAVESGDRDAAAAALRESEEEIGLFSAQVKVLGYMKGLKTVTDFWVTPVVGIVHSAVSYKLAESEVAEVFDVPLSALCDLGRWQLEERIYNGKTYRDCRYTVGPHTIWGATGKIIYGLAQLLNDATGSTP